MRLTTALRHIGFALGGATGARLATRLAMPVSGATLLRIVISTPIAAPGTPKVMGVDDWAWRRGHRYGTILVDLETHRVLELLPDRTADTLATCLRAYPSAQVLARDRSVEYAAAMQAGRPEAMQIADRWHLLRNLGQMAERLHTPLRAHLKQLPPTRVASQRRFARSGGEEEERRLRRARREKRRELVLYLHARGLSLRQIARTLGVSRYLVSQYVHGEQPARRAQRASIIDPYLDYLEARWRAGCENAQQLWREIKAQGYPGSPRQVTRWARARRTKPAPSTPRIYRAHMALWSGSAERSAERSARVLLPDQRAFARLLTRKPETLTADEQGSLRYVCEDEMVRTAYDLVQELAAMLRREQPERFIEWFERARRCGIGTLSRFAHHLFRDKEAVIAAMREPWSNGQVEGQINKLKLVKRQMYGRAGLPLLRQRLRYPDT